MFEKVNPEHPDKVADRIAGAIVDLAYKKAESPKVAVECLIGHGHCFIEVETSEHFYLREIEELVKRIAGQHVAVTYIESKQDKHLNDNQKGKVRCGDNGIFKGMPTTGEQKYLSKVAREIYDLYMSDGKYIINGDDFILCQSKDRGTLKNYFPLDNATVNPLGEWSGGIDVDTGAVNRKLGSDMGDAVTGGGLHGKDLSKADVSVNIYAHLKAQETGRPVEICCAIGDEEVDGKPYSEIVDIAKAYIKECGGFEKFAEWGFI